MGVEEEHCTLLCRGKGRVEGYRPSGNTRDLHFYGEKIPIFRKCSFVYLLKMLEIGAPGVRANKAGIPSYAYFGCGKSVSVYAFGRIVI